jgi:hypothetical protein
MHTYCLLKNDNIVILHSDNVKKGTVTTTDILTTSNTNKKRANYVYR